MSRKKTGLYVPSFLCQLHTTSATLGSDGWILLDDGDGDLVNTWELTQYGPTDAATHMFHQLGGYEHLLFHYIEHLGVVDRVGQMIGYGCRLIKNSQLEIDCVPIANDLLLGHHAMVGKDTYGMEIYPHRECPQFVQMRHPS